jgi:hypothetical protein
MANVPEADADRRPAVHFTETWAEPAPVFEVIRHVHETEPALLAVWDWRSAATVETRPDGRVTLIVQTAPDDVRAATVVDDPAATRVGRDTSRTERSEGWVAGEAVGVAVGVGGAVASGIAK